MPYRFLVTGMFFACMCFLLVYTIFLKAGASLIAVVLLGTGVASGTLIAPWADFVKKSTPPCKRDKLIAAFLILSGCLTGLAAGVLAIGVLLTGNIELSIKFAGLLEALFLMECTLLAART